MKKPIVAVQTAPAHRRGGSFLADPVTGIRTPLFLPDSGMNPDLPGTAETPETPAAAENEEQNKRHVAPFLSLLLEAFGLHM